MRSWDHKEMLINNGRCLRKRTAANGSHMTFDDKRVAAQIFFTNCHASFTLPYEGNRVLFVVQTHIGFGAPVLGNFFRVLKVLPLGSGLEMVGIVDRRTQEFEESLERRKKNTRKSSKLEAQEGGEETDKKNPRTVKKILKLESELEEEKNQSGEGGIRLARAYMHACMESINDMALLCGRKETYFGPLGWDGIEMGWGEWYTIELGGNERPEWMMDWIGLEGKKRKKEIQGTETGQETQEMEWNGWNGTGIGIGIGQMGRSFVHDDDGYWPNKDGVWNGWSEQ
ncbi:hypothetical protein CPB84DRAFT_1747809 [Gymnopilus junonius]|uniref:Uncharacterized protein n=1 Tax=Gymnopilus junonius TaxID=109634 RepID=A0A9P5TNC2_GYMJU|nr:hypothetical protein CPB84DRAFT_1747809 [Gymnopilus junonius]